ncbi:MAG: site-2 protease family protein [Cytophagaceae bacterium]|nr:site-2 protease family protein [Cytophagaceae bacterium]
MVKCVKVELEYPSKPIPAEEEENWTRTVISLLGFIGIFYFILGQDIQKVLNLAFVLFVHEAGHYLAMKKFNYKEVKMFFVPFLGAYVSGDKEQLSKKEMLIVILAGPVPGIIIGTLLNIASSMYGIPELGSLGKLFVIINAFNLIPVTPLDGGRLIETLFFSSNLLIQNIFIVLSMLLVGGYVFYSEELILLLLILFLFLRIRYNLTISSIRKELGSQNISYFKNFSELSNEEYWRIRNYISKKLPELRTYRLEDNRLSEYENKAIASLKNILHPPVLGKLTVLHKIGYIFLWLFFLLAMPVLNLLIIYRFF